jgi:hypothetical protein
MTTINRLSAVDSLEGGDQIPIYDSGNGDARKSSLTLLKSWLQANLTFTDPKPTTQRYAPSATGWSVTVTDGSDDAGDVHLIVTPAAGYAAGTITLPALASLTDKQTVTVNCTQAVTTLTVSGNGATVTGAPTSLSANDYFTLKFDEYADTWYRVA